MSRTLILLAVAALGFLISALAYLALKPYLPLLPELFNEFLRALREDWFLAGAVGSVLAVVIFLAWVYHGD